VSTTTIFIVATILSLPTMAVIMWGWRRWWRDGEASPLARFIKNSSIPIIANLVGKVLDLGFAAVTLRALGPTASGAWSFVALIASMYLVTIVNWGLNDLAVREAAAHPQQASRMFGITLSMRWVVAACVAPLTWLGIWLWQDSMPPLSWGTQVALVLLLAHLWPAGTAAAASASFQAAQRMEIPALVTVTTSIIRTIVGIALIWLLPDSESRIIGMGAVALLATVLNAGLLWGLQHRLLFRAGPQWDWAWMRRLWREALPLLLNSILLTVFFRFDAIILRASSGDTVLGLYDAAYKVISLTQIIPPYVVGALFPLLAHRAVTQRDTLNPLILRAIGVLQWVAWLGVVNVVILADDLIWVLGGVAYLPDAAHILRILIWYLPLSYATGVVQYALIAVKRQQAITWAFGLGTVVNITGNVLLIPRIGAEAAAIMTIVTEIALLAGLWRTLRHEHIQLPLALMARSGIASIIALGVGWVVLAQGVPAVVVAIGVSISIVGWGYQRQLFDQAIYGMVERIQQRFRRDRTEQK